MRKSKAETQSDPKVKNTSTKSRVKGKLDTDSCKTSKQVSSSLPKSQKSNEASIMEHYDIMSHEATRKRLCRVSDPDSLAKEATEGIEGSSANTPELRNIRTLCPVTNENDEANKNCKKNTKNVAPKQKYTIQTISRKSLSDMQRELDLIKPAQITFTQLPTEGSFRENVKKTARRINKLFPEGFSLADLYNFLSEQEKSNLKPSSYNTLVHAVKRGVKEALGIDYEFNPDVRLTVDRCFKKFLKKLHQNQAVSKAVQYETLVKFIQKASPRVSLMTRFLYESCMRLSPMCNVKLSNLEPLQGEDGYRIRVFQKNGVLTTPKVPAHLIRQIIAECKSKVYLFENKYGRPYNRRYVYNLLVKESIEHVGERINPHRLRHSHATHSNDIRAAQTQGGWKNGRVMLDIYGKREYKLEDLPTLDPAPLTKPEAVGIKSSLSIPKEKQLIRYVTGGQAYVGSLSLHVLALFRAANTTVEAGTAIPGTRTKRYPEMRADWL